MAIKPLTKEKLEKELARLEAMKEYEYLYETCPYICGIDEAGRGPQQRSFFPRTVKFFISMILKSFQKKSGNYFLMRLPRKQ